MKFKTKAFVSFLVVFEVIFLIFAINQLAMVGTPREQRPSVTLERNASTYSATFRFVMPYVTHGAQVTRKPYNPTTWRENKPKVLLVYTAFFGSKEWLPLVKDCPRSRPCRVQDFEVTYDKLRFRQSDFVMFHAMDMPGVNHLKTLMKSKPSAQRWAYFVQESPKSTPEIQHLLNGFFNLTWTYRSDSDIWVPYGTYAELSNTSLVSVDQDFTQGKSKFAAWIVSNCRAALRLQLVQELTKYVEVDVFGKCSERFGKAKSCPRESAQCTSIIKQYKFYLSFENALCEDYITEKYWGHLGEENVIPVVMGGANYSKLAIPGSYINVMDFKTVKELAEYLQYLDKNNTAYNEYFTWRRKYEYFARPFMCQLCMVFGMETTPQPKVYNDLEKYWVEQGKCNEKDRIVQKIIRS